MSDVANPNGKSHLAQSIRTPHPVLIMAGALMLFTILTAGIAKRNHYDGAAVAPSTAVTVRDLAFKDMPDGGVSITDVDTGQLVTIVQPATGGFLRGVMRGLVRDHHKVDDATGYAFRLTRWADNRLSLEDSTTHETFELESFGSTNERVFADLLYETTSAGQGR